MDWMQGIHLSEYTKQQNNPSDNNLIGQTLWDFYMYQIHHLRKVHADPHPGNFLIDENKNLIAIDFGCMKSIPEDFYKPYFDLILKENLDDVTIFTERMYQLEILKEGDSPKEIKYFTALFHQLLSIFVQPFGGDTFDFSDPKFFNEIAALTEQFSNDKELRKMNGNRGSKHFIYINRTFFGLYSLLFDLKCSINVNAYKMLKK
jgi:predicted unusual protein kinase regulating ubiquinone biosynthesis (AarF/ABC1/UbiB family)